MGFCFFFFLHFKKLPIFSKVVVLLNILSNSSVWYVSHFNLGYSKRCAVVSHCGFNLCFPNTSVDYLFICLFAIYVSPWVKCLFNIFAHFKIVLFCIPLRVLCVLFVCLFLFERGRKKVKKNNNKKN